ncbi:MAG TPA: twin-arginine translocation signal domain-containing protein [Vicinamibacterales bacterium]|nr:twin-arginine translocation signal domain-containing protein [Vicinamibacterales bacterium]
MRTDRRSFLRLLATATAAVATLDVEQLLWTPGKVKIFDLGSAPPFTHPLVSLDDLTTNDFIEWLRPTTIFARAQDGTRRVPFVVNPWPYDVQERTP